MSVKEDLKYLVQDVNKMDLHEFRDIFGSIIYGTLAATTVWKLRPFDSFYSLHQEFVRFIELLDPSTKEGLLRCHPDLTGKLIEIRKLPKYSRSEQENAGLHVLTDQEASELEDLNVRYKRKFRFTFIVCVRENTKESIFHALRKRLENDLWKEVDTALEEISKIAFYRLESIVHMESRNSKL